MADIPSVGSWNTNGELIADVHKLGWIPQSSTVCDLTYGHGGFWTEYYPRYLTVHDLGLDGVDFRDTGYVDAAFDVVVFDPPYKLNGTPALDMDGAYGVDIPTRWQDRMALILEGADEAARIARHAVLTKCQDQVCSGRMRWQTREITEVVEARGFRLADRLDFGVGRGRPQPGGRMQRHARHDASQLLIFSA